MILKGTWALCAKLAAVLEPRLFAGHQLRLDSPRRPGHCSLSKQCSSNHQQFRPRGLCCCDLTHSPLQARMTIHPILLMYFQGVEVDFLGLMPETTPVPGSIRTRTRPKPLLLAPAAGKSN